MEDWRHRQDSTRTFIGIDLGGTNTKFGLVSSEGKLIFQSVMPTPWNEGRGMLLRHAEQCDRHLPP